MYTTYYICNCKHFDSGIEPINESLFQFTFSPETNSKHRIKDLSNKTFLCSPFISNKVSSANTNAIRSLSWRPKSFEYANWLYISDDLAKGIRNQSKRNTILKDVFFFLKKLKKTNHR